MYTETKRSIQERKNIQIVMMSKEELYKLPGAYSTNEKRLPKRLMSYKLIFTMVKLILMIFII